MSATRALPVQAQEAMFPRSVFEAILSVLGEDHFAARQLLCKEGGVWPNDPGGDTLSSWHPLCETMAPGSPNPLEEPILPFPFSPSQLAAMLMDGWGYFIREYFGEWTDGPDKVALETIPARAGKANEALLAAYSAYRLAVSRAPALDESLEAEARQLRHQYSRANAEANEREQIREPGISDAEYTLRRERAKQFGEDLALRSTQATKAANMAASRWRKAVVQHLILPIDEVPDEAFANETLRAWPVERRQEALDQLEVYGDIRDTPDRKRRWSLIVARAELSRELRRWESLVPTGVNEAIAHASKVEALTSRLDALSEQIMAGGALSERGAGTTPGLSESDVDRQRRRLQELRSLGGDWVKRHGKWGAKDRTTGAFGKLVDSERRRGLTRCSEKSVRKDLEAAAQREADYKRAAMAMPSR